MTLPPGRFSVKVVVRENTSGLMGSFEAPVVVPELKQAPLKVSSVLLSTQLQAAKDKKDNPLIRNGEQLVPNLTHIVGKDQKMYFYYEVYDPASTENVPDVRTSLAFYRGKVKVFETPVVERAQIDDAVAQGGRLPARSPGRLPAAGLLHLPDQHHRFDRRQVRVPAPGVLAAVDESLVRARSSSASFTRTEGGRSSAAGTRWKTSVALHREVFLAPPPICAPS